MDKKIVCPHCQHEYQQEEIAGTLSFGKYLCLLGCGKRFSGYSSHGSKFMSRGTYQSIDTFIRNNKITSLIILLLALIFLAIGISISSSEDRYYKIAMNSTDTEEIKNVVGKIQDMEKLKLIQQRCMNFSSAFSRKAEITKDKIDIEATDKWASATIRTLEQQEKILKNSIQSGEPQNKLLNKFKYDPPIFLLLILIFSVITTIIILGKRFGLSRFAGIFLIVIGLFGLIISFTMRTTIGSTYNIGLLSEKQNAIIISLAIFLAGIIIQAVSYFIKNKNQ